MTKRTKKQAQDQNQGQSQFQETLKNNLFLKHNALYTARRIEVASEPEIDNRSIGDMFPISSILLGVERDEDFHNRALAASTDPSHQRMSISIVVNQVAVGVKALVAAAQAEGVDEQDVLARLYSEFLSWYAGRDNADFSVVDNYCYALALCYLSGGDNELVNRVEEWLSECEILPKDSSTADPPDESTTLMMMETMLVASDASRQLTDIQYDHRRGHALRGLLRLVEFARDKSPQLLDENDDAAILADSIDLLTRVLLDRPTAEK